MSEPPRLAILISGNGSNLQSIIDAIEKGFLRASISLVLSNNPDAYGLTRATRHGIATRVLDHRDFANRETFDEALGEILDAVSPDLIVLAGFMRILGRAFIDAFPGRILNIHPSLLPAYKGLNTHQRALDNQETRHGVSIHLVTAELDDGPVLLQGSYPIEPGDIAEDLQRKGHRLEHQMYPQLLQWFSDNRIHFDQGTVYFEQQPLKAPILFNP